MAGPAPRPFTFQEYLAAEEASEERHEYFDGHILAMAGASLPVTDLYRVVAPELDSSAA